MSRFRKRWLVLCAAFVIAAIAWAAFRATRPSSPAVPEIALGSVHPEIAAAIERAREEIRRNPQDGRAWGELSYILIANGFYEQSLPVLEQAQQLDPAHPAWPYLHGSVAMIISRPRIATEKLREALVLARLPEERAAVLFYLAQVDIEQGRIEEAARNIASLRELDGDSARVHFVSGLLDVVRGSRDSARDHLLKVAEHPSARKQASALLASLMHPDAASADKYRQQATQLPPDLPWPSSFDHKVRQYRVLTSTGLEQFQDLTAAGRKEEALDHLIELSERSPGEAVWYTLGMELFRMRDFAGAERAFREVIGFNATNAKAYLFLGASILEQAEHLWRQPDQRVASLARFQEAIEIERRAIDAEPNTALPYFLIGRSLLRLNEHSEAKASFRKAILIGPDLYEAHLALGEQLADEGKIVEAIEHLENAVRVAPPQHPEPRKILDKWRARYPQK
jgi:tetratricopeptide (TPR) repeat protein